jgi:hypothetical protein
MAGGLSVEITLEAMDLLAELLETTVAMAMAGHKVVTAKTSLTVLPAAPAFSGAYSNLKPHQIISMGLYWFIVNRRK